MKDKNAETDWTIILIYWIASKKFVDADSYIHFRHSNLQATVKVNMFYVRLTRITENKLIAQVRIIDIHSKRPLAKPHWTCYASRHIAEPIEPSVLQCQLYLR